MKHKIFIFLLMVFTICAVAQQMRVKPGTKITITSGNTLDVSAGNLVLESDISGDASFLNRGSITFTGGGQANVERYIGAWSGDDHGWHLLSSPIASQNIQPEFVSDPPATTQDFYKWDEVSGYWINSKLENGNWNPAFDETFTPGAGYLVAYSEDVTKNFTGVLNNDDMVRNGLTYTLSSLATGWHLLGNPYPCPLQWNLTTGGAGWNLSNIDGVSKIWSEVNASYSDINQGDIVPAMQGFMVHISAEGSGSLTIPASDRTHATESWFKADPVNKITLIAYDTQGKTAQECILQCKSDATAGFDTRYDSRFLKGYAPQFYALAGDEYLSTNTLPEFNEFLVIDMGFVKNSSGEFTIEAEGLNSLLPNQNVFLKDIKLNYTQDLHQNPLYHFTALEGDNPLRFKLLFAEEEQAWSADNIRVFQAYGNLEVHFGKPMDANVQVYNITGQLVLSKAVYQQSSCSLNMQTATGTYVVVVRTPEIIESKKVILF